MFRFINSGTVAPAMILGAGVIQLPPSSFFQLGITRMSLGSCAKKDVRDKAVAVCAHHHQVAAFLSYC